MVVQFALRVVDAVFDLVFGKGGTGDAVYCFSERAIGDGCFVAVSEAVGRLCFVFRIGGTCCVDGGAPREFTCRYVLPSALVLDGCFYEALRFVQMAVPILVASCGSWASLRSSIRPAMAGRKKAYSSGCQSVSGASACCL